MANVLVTGGSGLIGWRVTEQLVEAGHEVVAMDVNVHQNLSRIGGDFEAIAGDVTDLPLLLSLFQTRKISHVIHLGAVIGQPAYLNPAKAYHVNVTGTANIFDAALATDVERISWASSTMAVGVPKDYAGEIVDEDWPIAPTSVYGASKFACELMSRNYRERLGLKSVCIRPCLAFGIGRHGIGTGFMADAARALAKGEPAIIYHTGVAHQPIYDRDMAAMFIKAAFDPFPPSHVYNTPCERNYMPEDMAAAFRAVVPNAPVEIRSFGSAYPPPAVVSGERARKELNFSPRYTLEAAMREMVEHFRAQA